MEPWHLVVFAALLAVVALVIVARALSGRGRREKAGYLVGVVLYLAVTLLFRALPGDDRDWPWHLVAAVLAIAVAADVLRRVPSARPNPRQAGVSVIAWRIGVFFLTPIVVAIYVARRVMNRPVIRKVSLTP